MAYRQTNSRTILQRRSSLSNLVQQLLDGGAVIGITWGLVTYYTGGFYSAYVNMMFLMLGIMALTYDRFAIYRSNATYIDKAFNLLKAWSLTFLVLVVLAFLTKQSDIYSRSLIGKIFISGYFAQLMLHYMFRIIYQKVILHSQQNEKVLIVGQSKLAYYLQHKISSNPWIGEQVIGFIRLPGDEKQTSGRKAPGRKSD
ncbi:MAG: undecaprenyl-phosphate glucose phosphotransferase, partial [Methylotenera sp.]|nr:undecaprenyl-phosphate glucose phosphotransferase [Methylotenera sp.]